MSIFDNENFAVTFCGPQLRLKILHNIYNAVVEGGLLTICTTQAHKVAYSPTFTTDASNHFNIVVNIYLKFLIQNPYMADNNIWMNYLT